MGCIVSNAVVVPESTIPNSSSQTTIDELPVEIIYRILDELDIDTIFSSLYHTSKRFNKILSTYDNYHLNLRAISLRNFDSICSRIRPEQVTKLTLSDDENSPGLIASFLSKFSMNDFVRLRSLILIEINNEEIMNRILIPIADHTSLMNFTSIKIINTDEAYDDDFIETIMLVLTKPSLREVYFDLSYCRATSNPLPWLQECSIKHMTFKGNCSVSFVRNVFVHAPQLETFKVNDLDFDEEANLNDILNNHEDNESSNDSEDFEEAELEENPNIDENANNIDHINNENGENNEDQINNDENLNIEDNANNEDHHIPRAEKFTSIESTNYLKSLTITECSISMSKLEWLLQEMPSLKHFRLSTTTGYDDDSILDGYRWATLVTNMEKFEFVFSVYISETSVWNIDSCMMSYQTPFWTEKKQWFVSLEEYEAELIVYTLPYINDFYILKSLSSSFEYRTTVAENSLLKIQSMNNVRDLHIDTSKTKTTQVENNILPRFFGVKNLFLYGKWPKLKSFVTDLGKCVNLNTIEELNREDSVPTTDFIQLMNMMSNLQSIKTNTNLLDALNAAKFSHTKCLQSFIIDRNHYGDQRPVNVEPFCAMFPRIQHLILPVDSVDSCQYVLEQLSEHLRSVIFRIPVNDNIFDENENENENESINDEENSLINSFSEWIQELPKQYRCFKKQRQIHIWTQ